jgi:hypothetical protein
MTSQQAEKAAELQDPEIRAALDRRVREEGETVVKGGTGGASLEAQDASPKVRAYACRHLIPPMMRSSICLIAFL